MSYEKPTYNVIKQESGLAGLYSHLMKIGTEYYGLSAGDMTPEQYTEMLIKNNRKDILDHGTVYLYMNSKDKDDVFEVSLTLLLNNGPVHKTNFDTMETFFTVSMSDVVKFLGDKWKAFLEYYIVNKDDRFIYKSTLTVTCSLKDRARLVSDREVSFSELPVEERFKPGKITFIEPEYCCKKKIIHEQMTSSLKYAETYYNYLINSGLSAEQASIVLPEATKTSCIITTTDEHAEEILKRL